MMSSRGYAVPMWATHTSVDNREFAKRVLRYRLAGVTPELSGLQIYEFIR